MPEKKVIAIPHSEPFALSSPVCYVGLPGLLPDYQLEVTLEQISPKGMEDIEQDR